MKSIWQGVGALVLYGLFLAGIFYMYKKFLTKMVDAAADARAKGVVVS